jgi:DNA-binding CsgD family transcriptional regulator
MGRLADAAAVLRERFSPDAASQVVSVLDAAGVGALGRLAIHQGDEQQSRQVAQIAQVILRQSAPSVRGHAAWALAQQAMATGNPARAHQWLCSLGDDERLEVVPLFPADVADGPRLVHLALAAHDPELAQRAISVVDHRATLNPGAASHAAAAAHAAGVFHRDAAALARAVELFDLGVRPLALAAALEDLGVVAVDAGGTDEGVHAFSRALVLYTDAGATWDARRLRGRLRALGVRRRLVAAQRPETGWAAMTDSELAVARLVAQGLTNREVAERLFVSHHTVSGHLRSAFTKLDVNSRVELTRLASEHDSDP